MAHRLGIIGFPISHSISPQFQQAALDHLGVKATYQAWEVEPDGLAAFIDELRSPKVLGINVTVPHKEAVIPLVDDVDEWATAAGAVNTIVNRSGTLSGYNTDGSGFLRALWEAANFEPRGRRALVVGAGGAARGVVLALAREGAESITIANRTQDRARRLCRVAADNGLQAQHISLDPKALAQAAASAELIVHCTTVGMAHGPDEHRSLLSHDQIPPTALVNDLVYNPQETPLLKEARRAGASLLGGLPMLVYQGAASLEMWTGREAPVAVMLEAAARAMAAR